MKPPCDDEDFTFVYKHFFKELYISFPLSAFESCMFIVMKVAPSQLHLKNYTFLRVFQVLCHHFHIKLTTNTFVYFYQLKHGAEVGWV